MKLMTQIQQYQSLQKAGVRLPPEQWAIRCALHQVIVADLAAGRIDPYVQPTDLPDRGRLILLPQDCPYPVTLALSAAVGRFDRIDFTDTETFPRAYLRLETLLVPCDTLARQAIDEAHQQLQKGSSPPVLAFPWRDQGFLVQQGATLVFAALERGDTHILASLPRRSSGHVGPLYPVAELEVRESWQEESRTTLLDRLWASTSTEVWLERIRAQVKNRPPFDDLMQSLRVDKLPAPRAALFLQRLCDQVLASRPTSDPPWIAVACFRTDTRLIDILLKHGWCVLAVENFRTNRLVSGGQLSLSDRLTRTFPEAFREGRLRLVDFRDPIDELRPHAVIAPVAIDEAANQLLRLTSRPGSHLVMMEIGLAPPRCTNLLVDHPSHLAEYALSQGHGPYRTLYEDRVTTTDSPMGGPVEIGHQHAYILQTM